MASVRGRQRNLTCPRLEHIPKSMITSIYQSALRTPWVAAFDWNRLSVSKGIASCSLPHEIIRSVPLAPSCDAAVYPSNVRPIEAMPDDGLPANRPTSFNLTTWRSPETSPGTEPKTRKDQNEKRNAHQRIAKRRMSDCDRGRGSTRRALCRASLSGQLRW